MSRIHDALKKAGQDRFQPPDAEASAFISDAPFSSRSTPMVPNAAVGGTNLSPVRLEDMVSACPISSWRLDSRLLMFSDAHSDVRGAEEFRTLRSHLTQFREKQPLQTVLITSALPGEGKTFVTANLGQAIAQQHGKRVLLLDADLRVSALHQLLGASLSPGLAEFLNGEADAASILQRGQQENLYLISGGRAVPNPVELISTGRLKILLHQLAPLFDWIILDSPPTIPVSDSRLLAELCDGILLVVRSGETPYDAAQKTCQQFQERHVLGVVLNSVAPGQGYAAYYYSPSMPGQPSTNGHKR